MAEFVDQRRNGNNQRKGASSFVVNGPYQEYKLNVLFSKRLQYQKSREVNGVYRRRCTMLCLGSIKNSESELALGAIERMHKMGRQPTVVYTDGQTRIRNS